MNLCWWDTRPRWLVWAALGSFALHAPALGAQADFRVDVNLVVLGVSVTDRGGRFIRDLPPSAFHVDEDGMPQDITLFRQEDAPVAVGLVVDNSGSMQRKLPEVVAGAAAFARSSNPLDQMFVVNFNEGVSFGLPSGEAFVSDPDKLNAAMLRIHAIGETALYDAIAAALTHIRQNALPRKVLIVLSDGGDNASTHRLPEIVKLLRESDVMMYTVGLFDDYDTDRNPAVLKQLAVMSGGEAFFPNQIPAVTNVLREISRDIRNQYTIGYVPANERRDGTYRTVRVKLTGPHADKWTVRTRMGYLAATPASDSPDAPKNDDSRNEKERQ